MISNSNFILRRCIDISEITPKFLYEICLPPPPKKKTKTAYPDLLIFFVKNFG